MDPLRALLIGVVVPGAVALLVVAVWRRVWRGDASLPAPAAAAVALAAGYAVAFALLVGWPALPPVDVTQVSAWLALAAAGVAWIPVRTQRAGLARGAAVGLLGVAAGALLVEPLAGRVMDGGAVALHVALIAATFVMLDRGLARALDGVDPRGGALATAVLVGGAAAAILMSDTASIAQVTGALAASVGALFVLGLWRPSAASVAAATPVIAVVLGANLWSAVLYAGGRYDVLGLIVVAPLLVVAFRRLFATRRGLLALALPALVMGLPVAAAAGLAASAYFGADSAADVAPAGDAPADDGYDPDYGY